MNKNEGKIFGIGLSKTGTTSLTQALAILGYKSTHFPLDMLRYDSGKLSIDFSKVDMWDTLTDTPIACFYKELDAEFPNSKFILTIREINSWLDSCRRFFSPGRFESGNELKNHDLVRRLFLDLGFKTQEFDYYTFKGVYEKHLSEVQSYFQGREGDLLVLDICGGEGWDKLCAFLGKEVPNQPFPMLNVCKNPKEDGNVMDNPTHMSWITQLLNENWENYKTELHPADRRMKILEDMKVGGMSSENIRFLINEIVKRFAPNGFYLEVGVFQGCSLLSAALFNTTTKCIGVDNFSEFNPNEKNRHKFKMNLRKFKNPKNIGYYLMDYKAAIKKIFSRWPDLKINVYFYDGGHSYDEQVEGLELMLPHLSEKCVILVDDTNWGWVAKANNKFLAENPDFKSVFKVKTEANGSKTWWNGFEIITRGIE